MMLKDMSVVTCSIPDHQENTSKSFSFSIQTIEKL